MQVNRFIMKLVLIFFVASIFCPSESSRPRHAMHADRRWEVKPVGFVNSPYIDKFGTPKQATILGVDKEMKEATIQLYPGFEECISDLEGFDFIWVISLMHLNHVSNC